MRGRPARDIPVPNARPVPLPFFDVRRVILPVSRMQNTGNHLFNVFIPRDLAEELRRRGANELQMRVFPFNDAGEEVSDKLPNNCTVLINNLEVTKMPAILHNPYPGMPKRRAPRPIDLTAECLAVLGRGRNDFLLSIEWTDDRATQWMTGVWLVSKVDARVLFNRVVNNRILDRASKVLSPEETKQMIRECHYTDGDILLEPPTVSLLCPYSMTRIKTPVRPNGCRHLQCFDLMNYLIMNEKNPKWKCPLCNVYAPYAELKIDQFFQDLLSKVGGAVTSVQLLQDGTWQDPDHKKEEVLRQEAVPDNVNAAVSRPPVQKEVPRQEAVPNNFAAALPRPPVQKEVPRQEAVPNNFAAALPRPPVQNEVPRQDAVPNNYAAAVRRLLVQEEVPNQETIPAMQEPQSREVPPPREVPPQREVPPPQREVPPTPCQPEVIDILDSDEEDRGSDDSVIIID